MYHGDRGMVGRPQVLAERPELAPVWDAVDASFPVRITRSFASRADLSDPTDPLAVQVVPDPRELDAEGLADPVGEMAKTVAPWVIRKYRDRALFLVTKRCHLYCRYCFRRTHQPGEALDPTADEIDAAIAWMAEADGLREVILSGGDPLVLRDEALLELIRRCADLGLRIRIHSRAPITYPRRVTPELARALAKARVWMIVHTNHVRELDADVDHALATLIDNGVPVLAQSVLLRGVNDDAGVLADLFEALVQRRVRPYYLHHPDAVEGNAHFRIDRERGLELMAAVRDRIGGIAVPRYIEDPPSGEGKREVTRAGPNAV